VIYDFLAPYTPVQRLFVICTNFRQCRSPAATPYYSQLHVVICFAKSKEYSLKP
jgi:hypothetical protein